MRPSNLCQRMVGESFKMTEDRVVEHFASNDHNAISFQVNMQKEEACLLVDTVKWRKPNSDGISEDLAGVDWDRLFPDKCVLGLTAGDVVVTVILNVVAIVNYAIFIELWCYLNKNTANDAIKEKTLLVLGLFPVTTVAYQLGTFVPRAGTLVDFVAAVYTSISLFGFFHLAITYLGGVTEAVDKLQYVEASLNVGPCCCCCVCLPKFKITRKTYRILRFGILQTLILQSMLQFISAVLWADGKYDSEEVDSTNPIFYIKILLNISALMSLYVFNLLLKTAFGIVEAGYHLVAKYAIIIVYIIVSNLQPLILSCLATYNIIPCVTLYSSKGRASQIDHHLKILEMFLFLLVSRKYYRKQLLEASPLYFENPLHNMS
ncbi:organic solute transporter subunit alpha-like isoform X3 [Mobula birostris]|uniref:organic solute transporter subunit alpha-like isoform X3 n=1 Tax=Mobula birostris TaxID=1983395 RepID=UPI003B288EE5